MPKNLEAIFSKAEEDRIIDTIREAEANTSGEIRVHLSQKSTQNAMETTKQLFNELRMFNTTNRNAVLLHISLGSKSFAIYGDKGIHQVVPDHFWENTRNVMTKHFRAGDLIEGICAGVTYVGEQLKAHFPWKTDNVNELSDDISYD